MHHPPPMVRGEQRTASYSPLALEVSEPFKLSQQNSQFWRRFGFSALGIGLLLSGLILYAALFAYK
jgi:hypothetical protein